MEQATVYQLDEADEWRDGHPCPDCKAEMEWEDCFNVNCEDGWVNLYELDPLWYEPYQMEECSDCHGKNGWWYCPEECWRARQE